MGLHQHVPARNLVEMATPEYLSPAFRIFKNKGVFLLFSRQNVARDVHGLFAKDIVSKGLNGRPIIVSVSFAFTFREIAKQGGVDLLQVLLALRSDELSRKNRPVISLFLCSGRRGAGDDH